MTTHTDIASRIAGARVPSGWTVRLAPRRWFERVSIAALVIVGLHAANVASTVDGPYHAAAAGAAWLAVAVCLGLVWAFLATGRLGRTLINCCIGIGALVVCLGVDGPHAAMNGISRTDVSGLASGLAGITLLALGSWFALRGRRRRTQLLAIPAILVTLQWVVVPAFNVGLVTNAPRPAIQPASSLGYPGARDVSFRASDGVPLSAWFIPRPSGAVVIVMHGSHGTRKSELPYVRLLVDNGFGVLAVDARGHGESGGETNALGWYGDRDVAGAVRFLRQAGIEPGRIGGLGLSMGAEELLRAQANGIPLAAVVADGAGASTAGDTSLESSGWDAPIFDSVSWLTYRGVELRSGEQAPPALKDIIHRIPSPVLLIASNAPNERLIDQQFRRQIGRGASLWYVGDAAHTQALATHPAGYRNRVLGFLEHGLNARASAATQ